MPPPTRLAPDDPKLVAAREAYLQATALKIQIDRGEFGSLKTDLFAFFRSNPILGQFCPREPWVGHASTEVFIGSLAEADAAIAAMTDAAFGPLQHDVETLHSSASALAGSTKKKLQSKHDAIEYLRTYETRNAGTFITDTTRAAVRRTDHLASTDIVSRLSALGATPSTETQAHINAIQPFTQKHEIKERITTLFQREVYKTYFGGEGFYGVRRFVRAAHTPLVDMVEVLALAKAGLAELDSEGKRFAVREKIASFKLKLDHRRTMKASLAAHEANAASLASSFRSNARVIETFAGQLRGQVTKLQREIAAHKLAIEAVRTRIETNVAALDKLLGDHDTSLSEYEARGSAQAPDENTPELELPRVTTLRKEIADAMDQIDVHIASIDTCEIAIFEKLKVLSFCGDNLARIQANQAQIEVLQQKYKDAKVLVLYFRLGDDVRGFLSTLAKTLRGGDSALDSIGSMNVVLVFEAGVRAGYDLGVAALYAKVGMTLVLSGSLSIVDTRQMLFTYRLALYLGMSAAAQVGVPDELASAAEGMSLPVPDALIDASIGARCSLYDVQECRLYLDEAHWGAHWSHEITRRIVFLNQYNPANHSLITPEWLDERLNDLRGSVGANESLSLEARNRIVSAIAIDQAQVALVKLSPAKLAFDLQTRTNWQGKLEVVGYKIGSRATSQVAQFAVRQSEAGPPPAEKTLGVLTESVTVYTGDESVEGQATYHKFMPPSLDGAARHYLEIVQRKVSSFAPPYVRISWASPMTEPPRDPAALHAISAAVNFDGATLAASYAKRVMLPAEATAEVPVEDPEHFARELASRLDLIGSGADANKLLKAFVALPQGLDSASTGLAAAATKTGLTALSTVGEALGSAGEALTPIAELFSLDATASTYLRCIDQPRMSLDASGAVAWERAWTPQVYRGYSLQEASFTPPTANIPIIPGLSAYLGLELRFKREVAQYEVLGTDTFSYLKMLFKAVRARPASQAGGDPATLLDRYLDLHWAEIMDLLRNVASPGSGAFSELLFDQVTQSSPPNDSPRALAEACFAHFAPNDENPFESLARQKMQIARNRNVWAVKSAVKQLRVEKANPVALSAGFLREAATLVGTAPLRMTEVGTSYATVSGRLAKDVKTFEAKFNASISPKLAPVDIAGHTRSTELVSSTHEGVEALAKAIAAAVEALGILSDDASPGSLPERVIYAKGIYALYGSSLRAEPRLLGAAGALASLEALDEGVANTFFPKAIAQTRDRDRRWQEWAAKPDDHWNAFVQIVYATNNADDSPLRSRVPTRANWKADQGLFLGGMFQMTSTETKTLIRALEMFHEAPPSLGARRGVDVDASRLALQGYFQARITKLQAFLDAIAAWRAASDEATSKRMPNIVMLLEVPALQELLGVLAAELQAEVRWHLRAQVLRWVELSPAAKFTAPWITHVAIPVDLKARLVAYLDKSGDTFRFDSLMHGTKQLTLPGDDIDVQDATEKTEDSEDQTTAGTTVPAPVTRPPTAPELVEATRRALGTTARGPRTSTP